LNVKHLPVADRAVARHGVSKSNRQLAFLDSVEIETLLGSANRPCDQQQ
jgi:hypothetical protein